MEAAVQSMVLLKNEGGLLPLAKGAKLAILGPHFNSTQDLLSDYSPGHWWAHSPLMAAQALDKAGEISLVGGAQGCTLEGTNTSGIAAAVALAKAADVAVIFVGLTRTCCRSRVGASARAAACSDARALASANKDPTNSGTPPVVATGSALESEGHDRTDIDLQGQQTALINAVLAVNKKIIVVLIHGGALDVSNVVAPAILDAHYPGQLGGDAVLRTLLNMHKAAPAGRLTTTTYQQSFTQRPMSDMSMANITYKHYTGAPVYPFGYGLSYSTWTVQWHNSSQHRRVSIDSMERAHSEYFAAVASGRDGWRSPAAYSATITNTGGVTSDYVLLGFVSSPQRRLSDPLEPVLLNFPGCEFLK